MNVRLRVPSMTRDQFLHWAVQQEAPYEFDGFEPVPMTGGTRRHGRICVNLLTAIQARLHDGPFEVLMEAGVATVGDAVRYPDIAIMLAGGDPNDRLMPDVIVVFEVVSPNTSRLDRTIKLREYRAVPAIRRYVIVDCAAPDLAVYARLDGQSEWTATTCLEGETLSMPEIRLELAVGEIFAGITFD